MQHFGKNHILMVAPGYKLCQKCKKKKKKKKRKMLKAQVFILSIQNKFSASLIAV